MQASADRRTLMGGMQMPNCLILGGGGFLGSHLTEALLHGGYHVRVFDRFITGVGNLAGVADEIELWKGNFLNESEVREALKGMDLLFHYISTTDAVSAMQDPISDIEDNLIGSVRLLQLAAEAGVQKVIFPSSGGTVYGPTMLTPFKETDPVNPVNPYAISKLAFERHLHYMHAVTGVEFIILRYSNPYGERQDPSGRQGVIPKFLHEIRKGGRPRVFGDGSMIRDYIYVKDAIQATMMVLESGTRERVFNVGRGTGVSLNELVAIMSEVVGKEITPEFVEDHGLHVPVAIVDISRIQKEVGWAPTTDIREGIRRTWAWINEARL